MLETCDLTISDSKRRTRRKHATMPRLGIIGGGQLARMTSIAAQQIGCDVVVLEKSRLCPAAKSASQSIIGDWNTQVDLRKLAEQVDVITLENEFVDAGLLAELEQAGHEVWPCSGTVALIQDKLKQRQVLQAAGLPVPDFRAADHPQDVMDAAADFGFPIMLKARRNAYDGKGNATIRTRADVGPAWELLGGNAGNSLYTEKFCDFDAELAIMITRGKNGGTAIYPVVETVQRDHICHLVRAPAAVDDDITSRAAEVARCAIDAVGAVGSFGVEMFLTKSGGIMVNELAPRVHNSGHYTIETCVCSQFENHVRAVMGLPLGSTRMHAPAAVMVNLLGNSHAPGSVAGLDEALAVSGAHVHLYGKTMSGKGRKMGHVTALGASLAEAEQTALDAAGKIRFGSPA